MHLLFSKRDQIKQEEEFPSCHDYTLLKQAANGGGGPPGEGECLGCSEWLKRQMERGEGVGSPLLLGLGLKLKVR